MRSPLNNEEEAVTNINKVFYNKIFCNIYLKTFLICAAVFASTS